jgi:hypothetical protein
MMMTFLMPALTLTAAFAQGSGSAPVVPERPYPIEIHPGFSSDVSFEDVERVAIATLTRPLEVEGEGSNIRVVGLPPDITRIVGCQSADLRKVDDRITPPDEEHAVWVVQVHGAFVVRHIGKVDDVDGYMLIHARSGMVLQSGVFVPEDRVAR